MTARRVVSRRRARLHRAQDPNVAVADVRTMDEVVAISVAQRRLTMLLLSIFAALALLLAAVGIYGVIAYSVTQRTQEIGIRMALGASQQHVMRMIVGQAMAARAVGIVVGGALAFGLTRLMQNLLFGVDVHRSADVRRRWRPCSGLVAALASYVPGRRATRVDPAIALRAQ